MEINSIPEAFQTKLRLAIISALITGSKTFKELKIITSASDGNLGAQLSKLEELTSNVRENSTSPPVENFNLGRNR